MDTKRIVFVGVGGQGNLLSSQVLGEAAMLAGIPVNVSEVHGMAQRGGVVESAVVMGGALSSIVSNGEADILLSFEPSEALRALSKVSKDSTVITNVVPLAPFTVAVGKGVYPDIKASLEQIKQKVKRLIALNANALAEQAGSAMSVNIVMLGALAQSGILPLTKEQFVAAMGKTIKKKLLEVNLKAFDLGY
ncbi:MAG: indolepyruvate oxidoreductase subunit beta, partial [Deltaproteobacteria bacterium]|nr:indolepyruvate oxidoreductase subunit beta [Deltaproteobacteria bacterium]